MVRALWLPAVLWCLVRCVAGTSACQADSEHSSALQTSLKDLRGHSHGHHGHHQAMDGSHSHLKTKKHKAAKRKARLQARRKRKQAKLAKSHSNHSEPRHAAELLNEEKQETEVARAVRKSSKAKKQHKKEKKVKKTHACESGGFAFTFTNALNGGGSVKGCVRGLACDGTPRPATSVEVFTNTEGFGSGDYITGAKPNTWTVDEDCKLVSYNFFSIGAPPAVHKATLFFNAAEDQGTTSRAGVARGGNVRTGSIDVSSSDIQLAFEQVP